MRGGRIAPVGALIHAHNGLGYSMIITGPADHFVSVHHTIILEQRWLALRHNWREVVYVEGLGYIRLAGPHDTLQDLRALSHTCRSLRAHTLPLLWEVVHVKKVSELGRLRDALRDAPCIAALIRHVTFMWDMNGDCFACKSYPKEHGSLLDMAFIDRGALWERTRRACGAPIEYQDPDSLRPSAYFRHNGA